MLLEVQVVYEPVGVCTAIGTVPNGQLPPAPPVPAGIQLVYAPVGVWTAIGTVPNGQAPPVPLPVPVSAGIQLVPDDPVSLF